MVVGELLPLRLPAWYPDVTMGIDTLSPVAPAQINALLIPAGNITKSRYEGFVSRLRSASKVRLGDLSPSKNSSENHFNPAAFPSGQIVFNLSDAPPGVNNGVEAFPFEVNREPQILLAIADGRRLGQGNQGVSTDISEGVNNASSYLEWLQEQLHAAHNDYPRVLLSRLIVFESDKEDLSAQLQGMTFVPSPEKSTSSTMKTTMCDIASLLLPIVHNLAKEIQDLPAIESPWKKRLSATTKGGMDSIARVQQRMTMPTLSRSASDSQDPGVASLPSLANARSLGESRSATPTGVRPVSNFPSREQSQDRMSNIAQGTSNSTEKKQNRTAGRVAVVLGALYLQAGQWPDALRELERGFLTCRGMSDYIWHGRAIELTIACLIMYGSVGLGFAIPLTCYPATDKRASIALNGTGQQSKDATESLQELSQILPELFSTVLTLYARAANFTQEQLPQVLHFEATMRMVNLLSVPHKRDGILDEAALQHLVDGHQIECVLRDQRVANPSLRRHDISAMLNQAMTLKVEQLTVDEAIYILSGLASRSSTLGLQRKQAFLVRELIEIIIPSLIRARKVGAAEMGIHPAAGLSALINGKVNEGMTHESDANGLRPLLKTMMDIYGICQGDKEDIHNGMTAVMSKGHLHDVGDIALKIDILRACANICEALPDMKGIVEFNTRLLQATKGTPFMPVPHSVGGPLITQEEQTRLINVIKRTVEAASKFGLNDLQAEYWDDFMIRGIEPLEHNPNMRLRPHTKRDLDVVGMRNEKKPKDPFIFNPFAKSTLTKDEITLVAGDPAYFRVTFQNPFDFDIEIESLCLHTEGCDFEPVRQPLLIGPYCLQRIVMTGTPTTAGKLSIKGIIAKIRGCREKSFRIFTSPPKLNQNLKLKAIGLSSKDSKAVVRPLSSESTKSAKRISGVSDSDLHLHVIDPQPIVSVKSTSLPQLAIMVIEGESKTFEIVLQNSSKTTWVDFLLFSFQDSATRQVHNALSNKELPAADLHDLQLMLIEQPAIRLKTEHSPSETKIAPEASAKFLIEVTGRPGLLDGTIQVDYAYLGTESSNASGKFYTRQLSIPVSMTVNAGLDLVRCNILPFCGDFAWANQQASQRHTPAPEKANNLSPQSRGSRSRTVSQSAVRKSGNHFTSLLSRLGLGNHGDDHCLLLLDIRNGWPNPLTVTIQVREQTPEVSASESWNRAYGVHEIVQPGHTARSVLLVPRISLINPHEQIPTIGNARQFVVSSLKISPEVERANRQAFWFREELLKHLRGSWVEESTGRRGFIDLRRALRLNSRMIDALRIQDVEIYMVIVPIEDNATATVEQTGRSRFKVRTNEFATLRVTIHNRRQRPLSVLLRLQPSLREQPHTVALDLVKRLTWTGMLQQTLHPAIDAGERREVELGILALCEGSYEFGASVEEVVAEDESFETVIAVPPRRKVWQAKEPCMIDAVEVDLLSR